MSNFDAVSLPAGWYADPHGRAIQRYWNGAAWTPYVVDASGQQRVEEAGPPPSTMPAAHAAERSIVIQNVVQAPAAQPLFGSVNVVPQAKSMATAVLLTVLFGPLGLFYVSVAGGAILTAVTVLTLGFGGIIAWPISIVWAIVATNNHNQALVASMRSPQPIHTPSVGYAAPVVPPVGAPTMLAPPPAPIAPGSDGWN